MMEDEFWTNNWVRGLLKSHQGSDNCQEELTFARPTTEPPGLEFSTPMVFPKWMASPNKSEQFCWRCPNTKLVLDSSCDLNV
jgi:hypothetical protein